MSFLSFFTNQKPDVPSLENKSIISDTISVDQMIYIIYKYMFAVRDFNSYFPIYNECPNLFHVCSKSRSMLTKEFKNKFLVKLYICISKDYKIAHYMFYDKSKTKQIIKSINFDNNKQKYIEKLCKYKQQYNGRGEDPNCIY